MKSSTCVPRGGNILTATWTPEGTVGDIFKVAAAYTPQLPDYASPPIDWGREKYIREMFPGASSFYFERHVNRIEWQSLDG